MKFANVSKIYTVQFGELSTTVADFEGGAHHGRL